MDETAFFAETAGTRETCPGPSGESMKADPFDSTPEFKEFKDVMQSILAVSKQRLDELVQEAKERSPRKGNPHAPGQKRAKRKRKLFLNVPTSS